MHLQRPLLPPALLDSLEGINGFERSAFESIHYDGAHPTSIRYNTNKSAILGEDEMAAHAAQLGLVLNEDGKIPWSSNGFYLTSRPSFTHDPLFHAGLYYVQEASGMFLEEAIRQTVGVSRPIRALDLCAVPGGKSTLIQSVIHENSFLVSNEVIKSRVNVLYENIVKWGSPNTLVTNNDPVQFSKLDNFFDLMVIDAPCSGSGLFRRDPMAIGEWSAEHVQLCSHRQRRILSDAFPALAAGGTLIYCTCSYSKEEDEDILDWILNELGATSCRLDISKYPGIVEVQSDLNNGYGYRFYPDKTRGEGFFLACLQKQTGSKFEFPKGGPKMGKTSIKEEKLIFQFLQASIDKYILFNQNGLFRAIPSTQADDFLYVLQKMYVKKAGTLLGQIAGQDLIPDHELAMSYALRSNSPRIDLNRDEAIQYLKKNELKINSDRKGWTLAAYSGLSLGWLKILSNRANNYYPKNWRILK